MGFPDPKPLYQSAMCCACWACCLPSRNAADVLQCVIEHELGVRNVSEISDSVYHSNFSRMKRNRALRKFHEAGRGQ